VTIVWIGVIYSSGMSNKDKIHKIVPHVSRGRFYNHPGEEKPSLLIPSLRMMLEWYLSREGTKKHNSHLWISSAVQLERSIPLCITWIGHATFLIQVNGINILTDPIFGNLSPLFTRILPPGITLEQLPAIDFVIISHNHRDHMDAAALTYLKKHKNCTFLVPKGDKAWFDRRKFERVIEHNWWDVSTFVIPAVYAGDRSIEFTFLPAHHWTQRGFFDYNKSLWGSWMIRSATSTVYFAGDTAYSGHFKHIAQEFNVIDVALMPIGPCEPRVWMSHSHVGPEESGQAFLDLNARHFIPMHWGTYYFGTDHFELPYERLMAWWHQQQLQDRQLHVLKVGQRVHIVPEIPVMPTTILHEQRTTVEL
jgi:L-ascorbate metabolism protein UlaG (beta-lactamase superfamily)